MCVCETEDRDTGPNVDPTLKKGVLMCFKIRLVAEDV